MKLSQVRSLRLLPIVLVAVTALLLLKSIGLFTQGGYALLGTEMAQAQSVSSENVSANEAMNETMEEDETQLASIDEMAAQRAADSLFSTNEEGVPDNKEDDAVPVIEDGNGELIPLSSEDGGSLTEEAILQRLSDRRSELDARESALELQVSLVNAAESRLNERIASLEAVEARVNALVEKLNTQGEEQFDALVSMYANMKSSDAAKVFNSLNMDILLRIATKMSPRKMSPILADMTTERAQQLTVQMATAHFEQPVIVGGGNSTSQGGGELPQIVGQ